MANFNQKPADKVSSKPNFIKIVLKIPLAWILFNAVRIGISDALKQPSYSPSSTSEPPVPPHVQTMHDNMSCLVMHCVIIQSCASGSVVDVTNSI